MKSVKKRIVILLFTLALVSVSVFIYQQSRQFRYMGEDDIGRWSFDRTSIKTRIDDETDIEIIDVWMRRELDILEVAVGTDDLLWHIDPVNFRYKISDAVAKNKDGTIAET